MKSSTQPRNTWALDTWIDTVKQDWYLPFADALYGSKWDIPTKITEINIKNLPGPTVVPHNLLNSLLTRGNNLGKISELGWLIDLVKHTIFELIPCTSIPPVSFNLQHIWCPSSQAYWASFDFFRSPFLRLCMCSQSHKANGLPVSPT